VIGDWVLAKHALAATGDTAWAESKATMFNLYADELLSLSPGGDHRPRGAAGVQSQSLQA